MLDVGLVTAAPEGFWRILWHERASSTNDLVAAAALLGAGEGLVIGAETQAAGRGRWGRRWEDVAGRCLLFSALLRPGDAGVLPWLGAVAALAVIGAGEEAGATGLGFRWPNDAVWGGRKVAGVLVERGEGGTVVGLGVNVFGAGEELAPGCAAATLEEAGARVASREELLGRVLSRLAEGYALAREGRTAELLQAAAEADALAGRWVTVAIREGELSGLAAGLDERCRLRLRTEAGEMVLAEGEVTQVAG